MRKTPLHLLLVACISAAIALPACSGGEKRSQQVRTETNTTVQTAGDFGDSLDLSRLPSLVKQAKDADDLEQILNTSGVNNLDTNNDGKTDYLNVEESRDGGSQGFILYTNEGGNRMDIAKVDVTKSQSTADISVSGNPQYYGSAPVVYRSSFGLGEVLFTAWLFNLSRPRYYHAGYYFGHYPTYYRSYYRGGYAPRMSSTMYRSRVSTGNFTVKGKPMVSSASLRSPGSSSAFSRGSSSRTLNGGSSFSTTTNKRPMGSTSTRTTPSFGNRSTTSSGAFGSTSNRSRPSFSNSSSGSSSGFGSSSSRSRPSFSGSSSGRSSSGRSSFGGSSSRRRR